VPKVGYELATTIVKTALHDKRDIKDVASEELGQPMEVIDRIFRECIESL